MIRWPAEWEKHTAILMVWPHEHSDWCLRLDAVRDTYIEIMKNILRFERMLVIVPDAQEKRRIWERLGETKKGVTFCQIPTDDTWTRDSGPVTVFLDGEPLLLDFEFNGWGGKFPASQDNRITALLHRQGVLGNVRLRQPHLVLEGGSIDSDGCGTLLTTARCLLNPNRNPEWSREQLETKLAEELGIRRFLWLEHGYLAGDDTDSHVDILARFCSPDTIAYSSCDDPADEHFDALARMAEELAVFRTPQGKPWRLVPLPIPAAILDEEGRRLPAGYANFLILDGAVLVPAYQDPMDAVAQERLAQAFADREIVGIDCRELIRQGGSLHCATMQLWV